MMRQLQGFAAMSQMRRLTLLLLARTFPDKDVLRLKVDCLCHACTQLGLCMQLVLVMLYCEGEHVILHVVGALMQL